MTSKTWCLESVLSGDYGFLDLLRNEGPKQKDRCWRNATIRENRNLLHGRSPNTATSQTFPWMRHMRSWAWKNDMIWKEVIWLLFQHVLPLPLDGRHRDGASGPVVSKPQAPRCTCNCGVAVADDRVMVLKWWEEPTQQVWLLVPCVSPRKPGALTNPRPALGSMVLRRPVMSVMDGVVFAWSSGPCPAGLLGRFCTNAKTDDAHLVSLLEPGISVVVADW